MTVNNGTGASSVPVQGASATDAPVSGNPVLAGARGSTATPIAMSADGDAVPLWATLTGALNVADGGGTLTVDVGTALPAGDNNVGNVDIVTVPAPLSTTGGGTEATALRVTVASDSTGVLSVDDNGGSLTVDGTVAVSGTVTVDSELPAAAALADATANPTVPAVGAMNELYNGTTWDRMRGDTTNGLDVDVTRVTGTVTIAGAVTNAGAFVVQENGAALTSLQLIDDTVFAEDVPSSPADKGIGVLVVRKDSGASLVGLDGDYSHLQVDASGSLRVTGGGGGTEYTEDVAAAADPVGGMSMLVRLDTPASIVSLDGDNMAARGSSAGAQYVELLSGTAKIPGDATNGLDVDVTRMAALVTGTSSIGRVNPEPQTANGLSVGRLISAASTNATSLKASAGQVYTIYASNINAAVRYLKIYNKASAPTVGTDTPILTLPIPGNTAGAGFVLDTGGMGIAFATGIAYATTTGVADADTGAVAANEITAHILYK